MQISDLFGILHNAIEAQQFGKKISQKEMADKFGVSMRTYQDWRLGRAKPQAALVAMQMLATLEDEEIIRVIRKLQKERE